MYKGLEITPSASVQEAMMITFTYTHSSPISDEITHLMVGLGATQQGKNESFTLSGNVDEQIYARNSGFDSTAERLSATFLDELSKYSRIKVTDTFSNAQDPTTFSDAFGRTSGHYTTLDNTASFAFAHDLTEQLTVI